MHKSNYKNQLVYDKDKGWLALNEAIFSVAAKAHRKDRLRYDDVETCGGYFLKN